MLRVDGPGVRTTCPYCGVGCGILAAPKPGGSTGIAGDPDHPANFGGLCSKGSALAETIDLEGRLLCPEIGERQASWDKALDLVANTFSRTIAEHGPDSVAFYVSGQLLTEDYYVANKLMKGFVGSANIDTNSRLCMASSVAGHRRAFGSDTVPGSYKDLELADLIVLVGSNLAWCHPVLYQRIVAARERRPEMKIAVIDPRRTATADSADLYLPIRPDGDVALFLGLLAEIERGGAVDEAYTAHHVSGLEAALSNARGLSPADVARLTGLRRADIAVFYRLFTRTTRVVTVFSQGVNQSSCGTDKVGAIINCHLATGRIGRPGMGPFSVTGQPNAMGGREVGGLANMLASHMEIDNPEHREQVKRFWQSPTIAGKPGLKAVDMFRAVADGRIKALWIMATNPVDSMPEADAVRDAIRACPFVVVSDVVSENDTIRHAHVKLPAAAWGEKDGTVTNSERRISRQRAFLPLPGEARPDWWIICEVAKRMGFMDAFAYSSPAEIFAEHAALSAFENAGSRDFDIGIHAGISAEDYETLRPFQWPAPAPCLPGRPEQGLAWPLTPPRSPLRIDPPNKGEGKEEKRFFADGGFFTADGKARAVAIGLPALSVADPAFPLVLNTGRVRDHWHTMTRTGKSPRLSQHMAEPFAEIHPADAERRNIAAADIVRVTSIHGEILVRALVSERQRQGSVFASMHWTDRFAAQARVDTLVAPLTDPHSGQPAFKQTPVRIERFAAAAYGFAVTRKKPRLEADYWAVARCPRGWRVELAFADDNYDRRRLAAELLGNSTDTEMFVYEDISVGRYRFAVFDGDRLAGALYLSHEPVAVARSWVADQFAPGGSGSHSGTAVIAGRPCGDVPDRGPVICSCFGVGANQIAAAARTGSITVAAIGETLLAGTNCGSCRAEIEGIISRCEIEVLR